MNCFLTVLFTILISGFFPVSVSAVTQATVLTGIDNLSLSGFEILHKKRVGLITNHTGRDTAGVSTIDIIRNAPGIRLTALFSPEHGIRGEADEKLGASIDIKTGLPIHSLYGATCRPTPEMLKEVDLLVFDIQDIGTRFYTYIGTLSLSMRAAAEAGIPIVVLDRPNPINGLTVQGAIPANPVQSVADKIKANGCRELTSIHPIPTRHGMTIGELAKLFNKEFGIGSNLTVIPMQGWRRDMHLDQTGLVWINPSPNMKSLTAAILYPGPGILETTNLSVGRGTERPFQVYGAPWVDAVAVTGNLNARKIPGVVFEQCSFVPTAPGHPYRGKKCYGVSIKTIEREVLNPLLVGLHLVQAFYEVHPTQFRAKDGFAIEVGDNAVWDLLTTQKKNPEEVISRWKDGEDYFRKLREPYLLYGQVEEEQVKMDGK